MTSSSTKIGIVEHVAGVVDNIVFQPGLNTHAQSHRIARAAIIATLQFARDNVSEDMTIAGLSESIEFPIEPDHAAAPFRAMIDALLQEIGGRG